MRWSALRRFVLLGTLSLLAACESEAPPPPAVDAALVPAVDPSAWVRALAQRLPEALRARASATEPLPALYRRLQGVRRMDLRESQSLQALYGSQDATHRFVTEAGLTPLGTHLVSLLTTLRAEGLDAADFHGDELPKVQKRLEATLAERAAVAMPPIPTEAEIAQLVAVSRGLGGGSTAHAAGEAEAALLDRIVALDGPLPAWAAAYPALEAAQKVVDETRARWELRLCDALLRFCHAMSHGNLRGEERAARKALQVAPPPAPQTEAIAPASEPSSGPPRPAEEAPERGGTGSEDGDDAPAPFSAPPGATVPPILADRKQFLADRLAGLVRDAKTPADLDGIFARATPRHPQYLPLREALKRYRAVGDAGFIEVTRGAFGPGSKGPHVEKLQQRLAQQGLFTPPATGGGGVFDAATEAAVRRFQTAHRIEATGTLGKRTWEELEVPLGRRIRAIDRALDRVRKSGIDDEAFYVLVNIPDFRLHVYRDGKRVLDHKVVVGKSAGTVCDEKTHRLTPAYATPKLSAEMTQLVLAPYWLVTKDIKEKEYDPQRARDPMFYERNGYEVIARGTPTEWIRQLPSPANSLGFVKMLFPNQFAVYLHDTPQQQFFELAHRAASHGCVRVHEPLDLARLILEHNDAWDEARFNALYDDWKAMERLLKPYDEDRYRRALRKGIELQTEVRLKNPVPVHLEYYTAQVADDGVVEFLNDLYGHDINKWSPRNAPACVPESQQAREGTEDVGDEIDHLEREAIGLTSRIAGLTKPMERLRAGDKDARYLAARGKSLSTFVETQKVYAESVRAAHLKVEKALEKRKGEWSRELQSEAVKVKRLLDGLRKANVRAANLCEDIERGGK